MANKRIRKKRSPFLGIMRGLEEVAITEKNEEAIRCAAEILRQYGLQPESEKTPRQLEIEALKLAVKSAKSAGEGFDEGSMHTHEKRAHGTVPRRAPLSSRRKNRS